MPGDPFRFDVPPHTPIGRVALAAARPLLSRLLGLTACRDIYEQARTASDGPFEIRVLDALDIRPIWSPADVASVPRRGPLLVASTHPHGALDGLALAAVIRRARPDVRILANHLLSRIPELAALCFFVDPFGGPAAGVRSRAGLRAAERWLRHGGALIVFPAGEVACDRRPDGSYADSPWLATAGRMALATGAQVVPAFVAGSNSTWFYRAGRIHPALRTALLARELLHKRHQGVEVRLGPPMEARDLAAAAPDPAAATQVIRRAAEHLAAPPQAVAPGVRGGSDAVATDVERLPEGARLVESGQFQVFCAEARQIPAALQEIGRLREITYRAIGEGTGREVDLDAFDDRYLHLFSWDRERRRIVGAYRIGQTDRLMAERGVEGLYTRTLFRYDERLMARISPALELGRAFVRADSQKHFNALLLLWKGIGQFVVRHPEYRVLFGPVSISATYTDRSHHLLMAFLEQNHLDRDLAELVEAIHPRSPKPAAPFESAMPRSIDEANRLVAQAEGDGKGVPILLRQYLRLNARLIGFNVDPLFGDALDALMMVDLTAVDSSILDRYLGRQESARFLARHRGGQSAHAA